MEGLFDTIGRARKEYIDEYLPELKEKKAARAKVGRCTLSWQYHNPEFKAPLVSVLETET